MNRTNFRKTLIAAALMGGALVGTSARADPAEIDELVSKSYYLAQDAASTRCIVVDFKPTADGIPALAYESRAMAERAMAEASAYDILDCSNTAMSADGRDSEATLSTDGRDGEIPLATAEAAQNSASEQQAVAPRQ